MWQALFAAAVAAASTGLLAKKHLLFKPTAADSDPEIADVATVAVGDNAEQNPQLSVASAFQAQPPPWESDCEEQLKEGIFRFSSEGSRGGSKSGTRFGLRKRSGSKKKGAERSDGVVEQRKNARRVGVCLKKRKTTGKNVAAKCGSSSSKDTSLFGWGLNVGIMYMMSAGKAEISKLNVAMDETAKIVQDLKSELDKRKSIQVSGSANEANTNHQTTSCKLTQPELNKSSAENRGPNDIKLSSFPVSDYGEYASSVLTEEQELEPEVLDMDQLEAELESELQKLPWCITTEAPREEGLRNLGEDIASEVSAKGFHEQGQSFDTEQFHGVLPAELDQKLCHVLIEQQGSQIVELESELHSAQSKLQEKETELQALKDCVRHLTQLSLSTVSDDENEEHIGQEQTTDWNHNMEGSESGKPMVGMKRPIHM